LRSEEVDRTILIAGARKIASARESVTGESHLDFSAPRRDKWNLRFASIGTELLPVKRPDFSGFAGATEPS
jgi:hypothetical protein